MEETLLYCAGSTDAIAYAGTYLQRMGVPVADRPGPAVGHVLLDVPSFDAAGNLRGGGSADALLARLPETVTVFGGNLSDLKGGSAVDLLTDPLYLAENAYITAECALQIAMSRLPRTLRECPVLIIGWGRIGKCLGQILARLGADVTIAARKPADRAICQAMGFSAGDIPLLEPQLSRYRLVVNTVPAPVLTTQQAALLSGNCVKIELASRDGLLCPDVIPARGLPGVYAPESSGELIARTYLRLRRKSGGSAL